uniref:Uncharacterized protein n=1 Tax=Rhizophora mucronata TaxID=61149 RepID=A0A2P2Q8H9_RHIMU
MLAQLTVEESQYSFVTDFVDRENCLIISYGLCNHLSESYDLIHLSFLPFFPHGCW